MVLLEHLPLISLALGLAHHHSGRASHHSHPTLPNHRHVPQISADMSPFDQTPKLIAARAADETHETTVQVSQHHLQTILDRIKSLEEDIFNMMLSKADSSPETQSEPSTPSQPETIVVTTRGPTAAPATIVGGLFKEAPAEVDAPTSTTTIITLTTLITQTVTMPTHIVTLTAFPTLLTHLSPTSNAEEAVDASMFHESQSKAMIPFVNGLATASSPEATASSDSHHLDVQFLGPPSTDVGVEQKRPEITPLGPGFNASATFHRVSLSAASSGFRTLRRGIRSVW